MQYQMLKNGWEKMKLLLKITSVFQKNSNVRGEKALDKCPYTLYMDPDLFPFASKLATSLQIITVDASSFGGRQWEIKDDGPQCWIIKETCLFDETVQFNKNYKQCSAASYCCCRSSTLFCAVNSAMLQATHRCTPAPYGMLAVPAALPTHSFGDMDHLVIQIFALYVRCRLVLQ